jgi:hypothetical protein
METIEVVIYTFDELEDEAKEKARTWYRDGLDYPWFSEAIDSIRAFVKHFGAELKDWQIGSGSGRDYIRTDATNENFRGVKLKDIDRDHMPTGYCLDADLWHEFFEVFKRTGDAKYSFEQALEAAIIGIQRDIDYQFSDECIDETIRINEYRFTEKGRIWNA